jgi:hypothetical protein
VGEISDFISLFGFDLVSEKDYYTFSTLQDAPRYSIAGGLYLGAPAIVTYEGEPWEVMEANSLVYDYDEDKVISILTVTDILKLKETNRYFIADGMILPGSLTEDGSRVTDYSAFYDSNKFEYSEVTFE